MKKTLFLFLLLAFALPVMAEEPAPLTWESLIPTCIPEPYRFVENELTVVLPTACPPQTVEAYRSYAQTKWPQAALTTDSELIEKGNFKRKLLLLGTPSGNRQLARLLPWMPFGITADGITGQTAHRGEFLLWTTWPSPHLEAEQLLILTAGNDDTILKSTGRYNPGEEEYRITGIDGETAEAGFLRSSTINRSRRFLADDSSLLLVLPTEEQGGDETVKQLLAYWRKEIPDIPAITDKEALAGGMKGKSPIVVGTPAGNAVIAKVLKDSFITVEPGRISALGTYTGKNLALAADFPYPECRAGTLYCVTAGEIETLLKNEAIVNNVQADYTIYDATTLDAFEDILLPDRGKSFNLSGRPTPKQLMLEDFDFLINLLETHFTERPVNRLVYGFDVIDRVKEYRSTITGEESFEEFARIIHELLMFCHGDHLGLRGCNKKGKNGETLQPYAYINRYYYDKYLPNHGPVLFYLRGKYYTMYTYTNRGKSIPAGAELVSINGQTTLELQKKLQPRMRQWDPDAKLFREGYFPYSFYLEMEDYLAGKVLHFLFRGRDGNEYPFEWQRGEKLSYRDDGVGVRGGTHYLKEENIVYLKIRELDEEVTMPALEALKKPALPAPPRAVILDVSNNPGGYTDAWTKLLGGILAKEYHYRGRFAYGNLPDSYYKGKIETIGFLGGVRMRVYEYAKAFSVVPAEDSLKWNVPLYIIMNNVYSSTGNLTEFATQFDDITTVGANNGMILGTMATYPATLPNSGLRFHYQKSINLSGCEKAEDALHLRPEVEVDLTPDDLIRYWFWPRGASIEEKILKSDPFVGKILELLKERE